MSNESNLGKAIDDIADAYKKMAELVRPSDVEIAEMIQLSATEQPLDMLEEKLERHLRFPFGQEDTWLYKEVTRIFTDEIKRRKDSHA